MNRIGLTVFIFISFSERFCTRQACSTELLSKINEATTFVVASSSISQQLGIRFLVVAAGAAAVHAKAAPDFVNRLFVGRKLVSVISNYDDVIVGDVGANQNLALGGFALLIHG